VPEHLKNWWGPDGFTNIFHEFQFKPEGNWKFTMHGPDGKDYLNESVFKAIIANELIILNHLSAPPFRIEARFTKIDNSNSLLTWKMIFDNEKLYLLLKDFVTEKNEENLDRLEIELKKMKY
jgi:uncharacterized protein YndB with AHSA1/START domain